MMHHIWTKIVVAGLIMLGEGVFASESCQRNDGRYEANSETLQLSPPVGLDEVGSRWKSSPAGTNKLQTDINPTYQIFAAVTVPVSDLLKYHSFNPRAPPVPAS